MKLSANHRLATYGTLSPGEVNADQLEGLPGVWRNGFVRGDLVEAGWGAEHDCPGCLLTPEGEKIPVSIFESQELPKHWNRLDQFEGAEYRRVITSAETADGPLEVSMYELNRDMFGS